MLNRREIESSMNETNEPSGNGIMRRLFLTPSMAARHGLSLTSFETRGSRNRWRIEIFTGDNEAGAAYVSPTSRRRPGIHRREQAVPPQREEAEMAEADIRADNALCGATMAAAIIAYAEA